MAGDAKKTPTKTPSAAAAETRNIRRVSQVGLSQTPVETADNVNKNEKQNQPDENTVLFQDADDAVKETKSTRDRKRRQKSESVAEETDADAASRKKPSFERIWSEEDEIKLLNAIIHCVKEQGIDPDSASEQVTEYMHDTLNMSFSRDQVYKKVRRLKHRWELASKKLKDTARGPAKAHDQAMLELSQQIWVARDEAPVKAQDNARDEARIPTPSAMEEAPVLSSNRLYMERIVIQEAKKVGFKLEMIKLVLRGLSRLSPTRVKEMAEKWRAHALEGIKYTLAGGSLKDETLRECMESLSRGEI